MVRVPINIICISISASREYKAIVDENCTGVSLKKNNSTIWTPWCWRGKHQTHSIKWFRDSTNDAYWSSPRREAAGTTAWLPGSVVWLVAVKGNASVTSQGLQAACGAVISNWSRTFQEPGCKKTSTVFSINITLLRTEGIKTEKKSIYSFLFSRVKTILRIYFLGVT